MTEKAPRKRGFRPKNVTAGGSESLPEATAPFPTPPARKRAPIKPPAEVIEQEYNVGYRKPPKHAQFRPGQSGNPKGRKKGAKGMKGNPRALLALFSMYQSAVPEIVGTDMEQVTQPLSESDEAALAALKEILIFEEGTLS
jgi:hypothetical protein